MKITTLDPITDPRWDKFVGEHPDATIYHHSAWARVISERYRHDPVCNVLEDDDGRILAGIPLQRINSVLTGKRIVCLPCSDSCFPLSTVEGGINELLTGVKAQVDNEHFSYVEIRGWPNSPVPRELGLEENPYYLTHIANIADGPDAWVGRINRMTRRNLKRARESIKIHEAQGENDLREYHRLSVQTRTRVNLLPWPYSFSRAMYRHVIVPGHGFLLLAEFKGKIIGGSLCFRFGDTIVDRFNAWDSHYSDYRTNFLLVWEAMRRGYNDGFRRFHFGVSNPENQGLLNFKRLWWTEEARLPYYYYPKTEVVRPIPQTSIVYRLHTAVNSMLPEFGLQLLGRVVYRHMG